MFCFFLKTALALSFFFKEEKASKEVHVSPFNGSSRTGSGSNKNVEKLSPTDFLTCFSCERNKIKIFGA